MNNDKRTVSVSPTTIMLDIGTPYQELQNFRSESTSASVGIDEQPYEKHKKTAMLYQIIFLGIAVIFLTFSFCLGYKQSSWLYNVFMVNASLTKIFLCGFCGVASVFALGIAGCIRPEREAVYAMIAKAKTRFARNYVTKKREELHRHGTTLLKVLIGPPALMHAYKEGIEKLYEFRDAGIATLDHIASASHLDPSKRVLLYNQALLELRDRLDHFFSQDYFL